MLPLPASCIKSQDVENAKQATDCLVQSMHGGAMSTNADAAKPTHGQPMLGNPVSAYTNTAEQSEGEVLDPSLSVNCVVPESTLINESFATRCGPRSATLRLST